MYTDSQSIYFQAYNSFLPSAPYFIGTVTKILPVDMIFFLGGAIQQTGTVLFENDHGQPIVSKYYFLILSNYSGEYEINEMESIIEYRFRDHMPVTAVIMYPEIFKTKKLNGSPLTAALNQPGCCIYNGHNSDLFLLPQRSSTIWKEENEKNFAYGWQLTRSFYEGAAFYRFASQLNMAAFMLHQSAEHALKTILHLCMGDATAIHTIERLLELAAMFNCRLQDLFKPEKTEDKKLLQLLDSAYLDARYSSEFTIHDNELSVLMDRIKCIHIVLEDVWKQIKQ
jgi:HEPN domain-containing protein